MTCGQCYGFVLALILSACGPNPHGPGDDLYQSKSLSTGTDERDRPAGITQGFADVLVKVSGDVTLIGDPLVAKLAERAEGYVTSLSYRDRMAGIPIHDEQGTRDRPHDLMVTFDPERINVVLRSLGRQAWIARRPRLAVFLGVRNHAIDYVLSKDGEHGIDQRAALEETAWRLGMTAALPDEAAIAALPLNPSRLLSGDAIDLDGAARTAGAELALTGSIAWQDGDKGWHTEWWMRQGGALHRWTLRDVTFDAAFRGGLGGAAKLLAGRGEP